MCCSMLLTRYAILNIYNMSTQDTVNVHQTDSNATLNYINVNLIILIYLVQL